MGVFLSDAAIQAMKDLKRQTEEKANALKGMTLIWRHAYPAVGRKARPYVGRQCEVRDVYIDEYDGEVKVRVRTRTQDGHGFLEDNDAFHRVYRSLEAFEPLETLPEGLQQKDVA